MLNASDDLPIHQTPLPVAHAQSGDPNVYDRYFFNGFSRAGDLYFGAAMGLYANRGIIDASFSVVHDGVQRSVHASGRAPLERTHTAVGPVRVEVLVPLRTLRVVVDAADLGIEADLTFDALAIPLEEPRHTTEAGTTVVLDATRLSQWGSWTGRITVDGTGHDIGPTTHVGVRDRSWGLRPIGTPAGGAPPTTLPAFFWWWAPLLFDDHCLHLATNEHPDGRRWYGHADRAPRFTPEELAEERRPRFEDPAAPVIDHFRDLDYEIEWVPGTRRARRARITVAAVDGTDTSIDLEPVLQFPLLGLGYHHPDWGHGLWHGELAVGSESWRVADLDPTDVRHLHVQQLVRARTDAGAEGIGVLEQLVIGDHHPTGLRGFLDGAAG